VLTDAGIPAYGQSGVLIVAALVTLLLLSVGIGLIAQALAGAMNELATVGGPAGLRRYARGLASWRLRRWTRAHEQVNGGSGPSRDERIAARNRIALQPPRRPTWIGDRLDAADARVWQSYRLDLTFCWPRLWLVIPESSRQAGQAGKDQFDTAMLVGAWAVLYACWALSGGPWCSLGSLPGW
jgi:hypothetical protein